MVGLKGADQKKLSHFCPGPDLNFGYNRETPVKRAHTPAIDALVADGIELKRMAPFPGDTFMY